VLSFLLFVALSGDPLPSWNAGAAKDAILEFVQGTKNVPLEERIVVFDQDGTLWVEQPLYTQLQYVYSKVPKGGQKEALLKALSGMSPEVFQADVAAWLKGARDPRWNRPYTELTYLPMQEVLSYFRSNGFKTYIVTGGGQDFVRVYSEAVYGIPQEQVVGSVLETSFVNGDLVRDPKILLNNDEAGKPEGIHLVIGRRPQAAFGNSAGDREMLEYTQKGEGKRLMVLLLHDDALREYAYGPAVGLPDSKVGTFPQSLYDEAKAKGWVVVSMKRDWKAIFKD
jgi:phosphoserine phosphatase